MLLFSLVKKGYGTLNELEEFNFEKLSKITVYENMQNDIEHLVYEEAK